MLPNAIPLSSRAAASFEACGDSCCGLLHADQLQCCCDAAEREEVLNQVICVYTLLYIMKKLTNRH